MHLLGYIKSVLDENFDWLSATGAYAKLVRDISATTTGVAAAAAALHVGGLI